MMVREQIKAWFAEGRPAVQRRVLRGKFIRDIGTRVSESYFRTVVAREITERTVRTGAMDMIPRTLAQVLAERAFYRILARNTIAIDEKPIKMANYAPHSIFIEKEAARRHGPTYKPIHKARTGGPVYLLSAVGVSGVVAYALSDEPYTTESFNAFVLVVCSRLPPPDDRDFWWLLLDNASFHGILDVVRPVLGRAKIGITFTAPSTCFLNPCEEHFAQVDSKFRQLVDREIIEHEQYVLPRRRMHELIIEAVELVAHRDNSAIVHRAALN
jgi:hypothetical protein